MSYSKASTHRTPMALALLLLAGAVLWLLLSSAHATAGSDGGAAVSPVDATVGEGGTTTIDVNVTPPAATLAIWIIEVHYNPAVVQVARDNQDAPECETFDSPGGGVVAVAGCDTRDDTAGGGDDTLVAFGGWVENVGGNAVGLDQPMTVASVTFEAVGDVGQCSTLTVVVASFLDPDTVEHQAGASTTDGEICIEEIQGVTQRWGNVDCTGTPNPQNANIGDAILVARSTINLPNPQPPAGCPNINADITADGVAQKWGNVDCTGTPGAAQNANIGDAILIARSTINLPNPQPPAGCPNINADVQVVIS